jgi:uncharacterized protein (TIGR03435 family)
MPSWGNIERFDVEAVSADQSGEMPLTQARSMLQSLLEERFSLTFHHEGRRVPVYDLVLNKHGPKRSENQTPTDPHTATISFWDSPQADIPLSRGAARFSIDSGVMKITGSAITTATLIDLLQGQTDRMILDRTELTELFDVKLKFASGRTPTTDSGAASIFTAIQESGFRLNSAREPVEVLIIDSVQRPFAN